MSKAAALRKLVSMGWTVAANMPRRQSAKLTAPDGHQFYGDPRDLLDEIAHEQGRKNIDSLHAASKLHLEDAEKYGPTPESRRKQDDYAEPVRLPGNGAKRMKTEKPFQIGRAHV